MLLQVSIVSTGAKEDTKGKMRVIGLKPKTRYVCLRKFCENRPHTVNGDTVFFELTNMFSFSTKEHKEPLSVRRGIVKLFVLH